MNRCIFFDRDGIINKRLIGDYVKNIDEFVFLEGFLNVFKSLKNSDFLKIIITNQQGVGKQIMSEADLIKIHENMQSRLQEKTCLQFDDIYYAPDLKEFKSFNRKPNPGMLIQAMNKWNIDPNKSWMIGDSETDIIAANRAGIRSIFISEANFKSNECAPSYQFTNIESLLDFNFNKKA